MKTVGLLIPLCLLSVALRAQTSTASAGSASASRAINVVVVGVTDYAANRYKPDPSTPREDTI
jgi:hypothetical protein